MRTVTVTGAGTARETPDNVVVRVAASFRATGVADALAGADSAATTIISVGRQHTDASRIASTSLNVYSAYDGNGQPAGFEARHSLAITCTTVESAGAMLTALAEQVGDRLQVEGLGLEVGDPSRAVDQARAAAYADAVYRARHLAELAGGRLGEVQEVAEGGASSAYPVTSVARAAKASLDIAPGETSIGCTLTVTFELLS
jgi:uncharacterized protein YggE